MCIMLVMQRGADGWDELTVVHKPWWPPKTPFAEDELLATGGHSRFSNEPGLEVVVVPGQAAPDTTVARIDTAQEEDIVLHGPLGHFVYLGSGARPDDPVTLAAHRGKARETEVFARLDVP
jgi:hypothetical protein